MKKRVRERDTAYIIRSLQKLDPDIFEWLYKKYKPKVRALVLANNGVPEDSDDLFQEVIIIIYKKVVEGNLNLQSSFSTYLLAISKHLWLNKLRKENKLNEAKIFMISEKSIAYENNPKEIDEIHLFGIYQKHFLLLNESCKKLLLLFLNKIPLQTIAKEMGFSSGNYAKKRKFNCKERLIASIQKDPEYKRYQDENRF